jgi:UDP-2-acetamido-2-deoxy-ribo-hexuluronate aminotransferase
MREIPFLDLKRAYSAYGEEIERDVLEVLRRGIYLNGPETSALEEELSSYLGVKYAVGVSSGTEALYLILKALELPPESCVLLPAFTFIATSEVVVRAGLRPVFADIDARTGNLSPQSVKTLYDKLTAEGQKVSAVIAVSIFGIPADLPELEAFCREKSLYLIEDICQAFGAEITGKKVGTFGIASATSFYPTKNLSCCGDGGMVFTRDFEIYQRIKVMKEHGQTAPYFYAYHGINGRIDEIQCAILRVKFRYFQRELNLRRGIAELYNSGLKALEPDLEILEAPPQSIPALSIYSIKTKTRDSLRDFLTHSGIGTRIYYPLPLHLQPVYQELGYREGNLPETERFCQEVLSLPFFPYLKGDEVEYVIGKIREFYRGKGHGN